MPAFVLATALAAETYFLLAGVRFGARPPPWRAPTGPPPAPIAQLVSRHNGVKVQNEGELVWEDARNGQTLFRRQSLLTLEGSKADVDFLDGTGLQVDERSLVVLEKTPADDSAGYKRLVVRLVRGTLHKSDARKTSRIPRRMGQETPEIEVRTSGATLELGPTSELTIIASADASQGARVLVQNGEVGVRAANGSLTAQGGEEVLLPAAGSPAAPTARKLPFTPLSPKGGQALEALSRPQPVRFRWNVAREAAEGNPQELEVSRDAAFKEGVLRSRINAAEPPLEHVELNLELPAERRPTLWFWRVRTAGPAARLIVGPVESFWLRPRPAPDLILPREQASIESGKAVDFAWTPLEDAADYELEVEGHDPVASRIPYARLDARKAAELLAHGRAFWRVRARYADGGASEWSARRELTVREPAPPENDGGPPPPDKLEEPEISTDAPGAPTPSPSVSPSPVQSFLDLLVAPARAATPADPGYRIRLKWKAVRGIDKYRVQISTDRKFKEILTEAQSSSPEWIWNYRPEAGKPASRLYFRVASVDAAGKVGKFSSPRKIDAPAGSETFSALEDVGLTPTIVPADAANGSDLQTLTAHPAALKSPVDSIDIRDLPSRSEPTPTGESAAAAAPAEEATSDWSWGLSLGAGLGDLSQEGSDPALTSVGTQAPYARQRVSFAAELLTSESLWESELQASFASFNAASGARPVLQDEFGAVSWRARVTREPMPTTGPWRFSYGAVADHSFRWVKNGPQSVDARGALSLGPSVRIMRSYGGLGLNLPMTGILTGGQAGIQGWIWGEWNLAALGNTTSIALRAEAELSYLRWSEPAGTSTLAWVLWVAPAFRF